MATSKHRPLDRLYGSFFRPLAFFSKEFIQVRRQPRLILMLIIGPFLVLLLFGLGYSSSTTPVRTILVLPAESRLPTSPAVYKDQIVPPFVLMDVTRSRQSALEQLHAQRVDAVMLFPERVEETLRQGQQASIELHYNELDPLERSWLEYFGYVQTNELNRQVLIRALQGQPVPLVPDIGLGAAQVASRQTSIPPEVVVSPFTSAGNNVAPTSPGIVGFYAPGVMALLVQHIAVTLTALAVVRERLRGAIEIFRISPLSPREILAGKYLSHFIQTGVLAALLVGVFVLALNVPVLAGPLEVAGALALLIAASLGVGFLISAISHTETQAVQFSMLVLLASVFFSGFFLPLENLLKPVWAVSYALPVTYGIKALQSLMLRGEMPPAWILLALGGMAIGLFLAASLAFQANFRRR